MNKSVLIGRLTKDVELKTTQSGVSVCSFTLAVNRRFKNSEGKYDADFINCVAWRQQAEFICKCFTKGSMLALCGSIQTRSYEKDGSKVYITEVVADEVSFVGEKKQDQADVPQADLDGFLPMPNDSDLPF